MFDRPMSHEEMTEIASAIEEYHRVFYVFWGLASVQFTDSDELKTAAIYFPKGGQPFMRINQKFWNSLNWDGKIFIICHECLHVLLDHGMRNARNVPGATPKLINMAQDIVINHMIVDLFGYMRERLHGWERYCWIETCFAIPPLIERNREFMYYLLELIKDPPPEGPEQMDDHSGFDDGDADDLANGLAEELTIEELEELIKAAAPEVGRGTAKSPFSAVLDRKKEKLKVRFGSVIAGLKRNAKTKNMETKPSFVREDRRFAQMHGKVMMPGEHDSKAKSKRLITALFMDCSGSCMSYITHFSKVRDAFEREPELFDVSSYVFDTSVSLIERGAPVNIGGGTSFHIIEAECKRIEKEKGRYPDCVVVLTDGYGNSVSPTRPERWVWLITPGGSRSYCNRKSKALGLQNVIFDES